MKCYKFISDVMYLVCTLFVNNAKTWTVYTVPIQIYYVFKR